MGSFGVTGTHSVSRAKGPGVTIGRSGASIGVVSYIDEDYWPLNTCLFAKDFLGNHPRFVFYFLKTLDLAVHNSGSAQPSLNRNYIAPLPMRFPEPVEQEAIADTLGALDDKIEVHRRMNGTLEAMARAVFRDWFVDFGPTRRQMAGASDPHAILGGLIENANEAHRLAPLFPAALGDNGLPEGWEERPISQFLEIIGGGTPKTSVADYWGGEIPWFSVVDTPSQGDVFVHRTEKYITNAGLQESSARMIPTGTTIISARGTVGNLAIAPCPMTFNQSCYALRASIPAGDIFVYLAAENMVERLKKMAHGSVFSTITRKTFDSLSLPDAGSEVMREFEKIGALLFDKVKLNGEENLTLADTRNLLLPKLMSGEIRLKNAEAMA